MSPFFRFVGASFSNSWLAGIGAFVLAVLGINLQELAAHLLNPPPDLVTRWWAPWMFMLGALWLTAYVFYRQAQVQQTQKPANFKSWDGVSTPAIWQISWLWNDLEPITPASAGTLAYPTFQKLKEHLDAGQIAGVTKVDDSWIQASPTRQAMIDYCLEIGARPKYLFPERRNIFTRLRNKLGYREVPRSDIGNYTTVTDLRVGLFARYGRDLGAFDIDLMTSLLSGKASAIARPITRGLKGPYVLIPQGAWHDLTLNWQGVRGNKGTYDDVRIKFK